MVTDSLTDTGTKTQERAALLPPRARTMANPLISLGILLRQSAPRARPRHGVVGCAY